MKTGIDLLNCGRLASDKQKSHEISIQSPTKEQRSNHFSRKEKKFIERESLFQSLSGSSAHAGSLYRLCLTLSLICIFSIIAYSYIVNKGPNVTNDLLWWNIRHIPIAVTLWFAMHAYSICGFFLFRSWPGKSDIQIFNALFLLIAIGFHLVFIILPTSSILLLNMSRVSSVALLMEQARLLMKTYAFLRENIPKVFQIGKNDYKAPALRHVALFLFAPTMIYKDEYPRNNKISVKAVCVYVFELALYSVISAYLLGYHVLPEAENFCSIWTDTQIAIRIFLRSLIPSTILLLGGFYAFFHSWCNLLGELTLFADRLFYMDWWNSSSFKIFFKTWNLVIQDWLYTYVYCDAKLIIGSRKLAAITVFLISAVVHEYVLAVMFRFFYPVLIISFAGIGFILKLLPSGEKYPIIGNLFMWISLPIGSSLILTAYTTEYYARSNCPDRQFNESLIMDFITPYSWTCLCNHE